MKKKKDKGEKVVNIKAAEICDAKCTIYSVELARQWEAARAALTKAEIEVISQTGDTWHSIENSGEAI